METLISQLDQKYAQYRKILSNERHIDSDDLIFDSAYEYFCITEKQPKIKEIIGNDGQDVIRKKQEIIKQNKSVDIQNELIKKTETHSLSFYYGEILRDVYIPMNKYKNSVKLLSPKEVIGDTSLFREKFLNVMFYITKKIIQFFGISYRKDLDMHLALQKVVYNFRQKKYPIYMERVHTLLIPQLLEIHTKKPEPVFVKNEKLKKEIKKIEIIIDTNKGIYRADKPDLCYGIKSPSGRLDLITIISRKSKTGLSELVKETMRGNKIIRKEIDEINLNFREFLNVADDLIFHLPTTGYCLNNDKFYIKLEP